MNKEVTITLFCSLLFVVLFFAMILFVVVLLKRIKQLTEENRSLLLNYSCQEGAAKNDMVVPLKLKKNFLQACLFPINRVCSVLYETSEKNYNKVVLSLKQSLRDIIFEPSQFKAFKSIVDDLNDDVVSLFYDEMPNLQEAEYRLFILYASGLSVSIITLILDISKTTLYTRASRLRSKIKRNRPLHAEIFQNALTRDRRWDESIF